MIGAPDFFLFDERLLTWLLLAFGAAMVVGNLAALWRPPAGGPGDEPSGQRPSTGRVIVLVGIGLLASVWAVASLVSQS